MEDNKILYFSLLNIVVKTCKIITLVSSTERQCTIFHRTVAAIFNLMTIKGNITCLIHLQIVFLFVNFILLTFLSRKKLYYLYQVFAF